MPLSSDADLDKELLLSGALQNEENIIAVPQYFSSVEPKRTELCLGYRISFLRKTRKLPKFWPKLILDNSMSDVAIEIIISIILFEILELEPKEIHTMRRTVTISFFLTKMI